MLPICIYLISNTFLHDLATIDCVHTKDIPEDVLNTYCWIHSTYTIPSAFWKRIGGQGTAGMVRVMTVTVQVLMLLTPASTRQ